MFKLTTVLAMVAATGAAHAVTSPRSSHHIAEGQAFAAAGGDHGQSPIASLKMGAQQQLDSRQRQASLAVNTIPRVVGSASALPEPMHWGIMILGFGMVGLAMRRKAGRAHG